MPRAGSGASLSVPSFSLAHMFGRRVVLSLLWIPDNIFANCME